MLQLAIFDAPGGLLLADMSGAARNVIATTNQHGFASLTADIAISLSAAFALYDRPGLPHVVLADGAQIVFEGRLEDVLITDTGATLQALGYWRALSDLPYTALWSDTSVAGWRPVLPSELGTRDPARWEMDTNNRLYMAPRKDETFGTPNYYANDYTYETLSGGERLITTVTFTYAFTASSNWTAALTSYTRAFGSGATEWSLVGNGALQTGTVTETLAAARDRVCFSMYCTAAAAAYTGETGAYNLTITGLRIKTTTAATVTADAIAGALATYVNGINSTQLSASATLIAAPGLDLTDEVYEDAYPADILTRLVGMGDNQTPPRQWEVGVWENRLLHLRVRGAVARTWYVDAGSLDVQRSIDTLANSAYGVFASGDGMTQRTTTTIDADSIARYGVTRRAAVAAQTTSATQAGVHRDAYIADHSDIPPRARITIPELYDGAGGRWSLWQARSGDTITIRNLPPTLSLDVDRIRTFRIAETSYSCDANALTVTPELPLPSLEVLIAQLAVAQATLKNAGSRQWTQGHGGGGSAVPTDHGALTGLTDDDHTQYLLETGARAGASAGAQTFTYGLIINEGGADSDTRIEGDTDANLLFADASTDRVGIGTNAPATKLHGLLIDAGTNAVVNVATLGHDTSGTAAVGFGAGLLFQIESSTTAAQEAAQLAVSWTNATHATRTSMLKISTVVSGVSYPFLHNYRAPSSVGNNVFLGENSGNLTMSPGGGSSGLASYNVGVGSGVLIDLTTGYNNLAIGSGSLGNTTTGYSNVGLGTNTLAANVSGNESIAIGTNALITSTASGNMAIGSNAMLSNTTGTSNAALGNNALLYNVDGAGNMAIGTDALRTNVSGYYNTAVGVNALYSSTGWFNIGIGLAAGSGITSGGANTAIGYSALAATGANGYSIGLGQQAGQYETAGYKLFVDSLDRTDEAGGRIKSLIYGVFAAAPVDQLLRVNAVQQTLITDAATNAATTVHKLSHNTSGTAAAGFGTKQLWDLQSSTTADQAAAAIQVIWYEATHATRKADIILTAYDTAAREGLRIRGNGSAPAIGFLGATPAAQPSAYTQTYSTAARTVSNPTAATLTDSTGGTADTTLASVGTTYSQTVIRNNFADLAAMVNKNTADNLAILKVVTQIIDDLQAYGLLA